MKTLGISLLCAFFNLVVMTPLLAGSATWKKNPSSGDWNTAINWTAGGPPNGPADTATFAFSNTTDVSLSANTVVNGIVFNAGESVFTITAGPTLTLNVSGAGIANNSGNTQSLVTRSDINGTQHGTIQFTNGATAGNGVSITDSGPEASDSPGGITQFFDSSTAGSAEIFNTIGSGGGFGGGVTEFHDSSTAGNARFSNAGRSLISFFDNSTAGSGNFFNGGKVSFSNASTAGHGTFFTDNGTVTRQPPAGSVSFSDTSTAGNGTFTDAGADTSDSIPAVTVFLGNSTADHGTFTSLPGVEGGEGAKVIFAEASTAANAILIANGGSNGDGGGSIQFSNDSTGGQARVKVFGNGFLDIGGHNAPGASIGSIQGSGLVFLGALNLIVGSNNRSTDFSGVIQDGGLSGGTGGSLTKIGNGELVLRHANTYTGGTAIDGGALLVTAKKHSATGSGSVFVNKGTLGGNGNVAGIIHVGNGGPASAFLAPGVDDIGKLTTHRSLFLGSNSVYRWEFDTKEVLADSVSARGVTISDGGLLSLRGLGSGTLENGTTFTVIDNVSREKIAGTFSNLADGAVITVSGTNFQANYEGGDGNDLTLTVVP